MICPFDLQRGTICPFDLQRDTICPFDLQKDIESQSFDCLPFVPLALIFKGTICRVLESRPFGLFVVVPLIVKGTICRVLESRPFWIFAVCPFDLQRGDLNHIFR